MAERHPREETLRRVHGTGALFSAAYGNVGSSIYYALGVTAAFALGLTPIAFMVAGVIFAFTAASYTEATVMYPEAGGSSSFARHAFNELASFVAAWAQMLNYVITVAISAFFVPHYLSVFWPSLGHGPGDVIGGIALVGGLALLNIKGTKESSRLNLVLAIGDLATQIVLVGIGIALVLSPHVLVSNVHLGVAPTWGDFALGIAVGMIAYTGIETISNMSEEARDAPRTIPRGVGLTVVAVLVLYVLIPIVALSAMPVTQNAAGHYSTVLGTKFASDPVLGIVENLGLSDGMTHVLRYYVGVLAVFESGSFSEEAVSTAARLAARRRRGIHVFAIVTIPTNLPLDAPLEDAEAEANSMIEQSKLIGGLRVTGHIERVRPGQEARAIIEEVRSLKAAAVGVPP